MRSKVIPPRFPQDSPKDETLAYQASQGSPPPSLKVVSITEDDDEGLTEIAWIKRQCRKHALAFCGFFIQEKRDASRLSLGSRVPFLRRLS